MSNIRDVVNDALLYYVQEHADPHASEVLKVYEEIEHALLENQVGYGAEDRYSVRIIYRRDDCNTGTYLYSGTFGELLREIINSIE